jgi:hypothetical protein
MKENVHSHFLLPFSVLSENRKEPFTEEMEKAAIFCLAELERAKGGGLIMKQPTEKLVFIAEGFYPFLLVPWNGLNLIFDGLNMATYTFTYKTMSDVKTFIENFERSSKKLETYVSFLFDNINYFQASSAEKEIMVNGLIVDSNFLSEFTSYLSEGTQIENLPPNIIMLSPLMDESSISSIIEELSSLKSEFKENVNTLYRSMKFLSKATRNFVKTIRNEMRMVKEEFAEEIAKRESFIKPEVDRINEEYNEQIAKTTKEFAKQLLPLQKEKVKLEKTKEQTLNKIERYKIEAKTCVINKDVVGERKWKEKTDETKKELSEIEAKIKEVEGKIKELEESKSVETFRLRSEWEAKIKEAQKELLELEASRDAKIQLHRQEVEKLEKQTSSIIEQIDKMAKMRETDISNFEKLGIKQTGTKNALIYIPFYLACYQSESKKRYALFPPSIVNSVSLFAKIKGALGKTKVKQLLVPRFKTITPFLHGLLPLIERDAVFERDISEAGDKADMLKADLMREKIKSGLERLKEEGWFSEKEYEAFAEPSSKARAQP